MNTFDDFELYETCEEYYNDEDFEYFLTEEDEEELNNLF